MWPKYSLVTLSNHTSFWHLNEQSWERQFTYLLHSLQIMTSMKDLHTAQQNPKILSLASFSPHSTLPETCSEIKPSWASWSPSPCFNSALSSFFTIIQIPYESKVGLGQGTLQGFVLVHFLSSRNSYSEHINYQMLLSPALPVALKMNLWIRPLPQKIEKGKERKATVYNLTWATNAEWPSMYYENTPFCKHGGSPRRNGCELFSFSQPMASSLESA